MCSSRNIERGYLNIVIVSMKYQNRINIVSISYQFRIIVRIREKMIQDFNNILGGVAPKNGT